MLVVILLGAGQKNKKMYGVCEEVLHKFAALPPSSALDAVTLLATWLEDSPATNAATGSEMNQNGNIECDACLIVSPRKRSSAVAALVDVKNPVQMCRRMLQDSCSSGLSAPRFLVGSGALEYAKLNNLELASLETPRAITAFKYWTNQHPISDTIGVLAFDGRQWAACSSSGGSLLKFPGRVGPAAVVGASADVSQNSAAIASGFGEDILQVGLARVANNVDSLEDLPQLMSEHELQRDPYFGIVRAQKHEGNVYVDYFHTTESMCFGVYDSTSGEKHIVYTEGIKGNSGGWKFKEPSRKNGEIWL